MPVEVWMLIKQNAGIISPVGTGALAYPLKA